MRINHNIQALNSYGNLSKNSSDLSKQLERLSSGLRINRAADDAAGLAISEKMRSQIRGLDMAERNTMDGISLIQTAEGALGTTHEILQRMRELAVQASNGTLEDDDREAVQSEIDQLTQEIDRIARTTQFNAKPLLRGSAEGRAFASTVSTALAYGAPGSGTWSGSVTADPSDPAAVDFNLGAAFGGLDNTTTASGLDGKIIKVNNKTYEFQVDASRTVTNGHIAVDVSATWNNSATTDTLQLANVNLALDQLTKAINANDPKLQASFVAATDAAPGDGAFDTNGILTIQTKDKMSPKDAKLIEVFTDVPAGASLYEKGTTKPVTTLVAPEASSTLAKTISISLTEVPKAGDSLTIDDVEITFGPSGTTPPPTITTDGKSIYDILNDIKAELTAAKAATPAKAEDLASIDIVGNALILSTNKTDSGLKDDKTSTGLDIKIKDADFAANAGRELKVNMQIGANAGENMELTLGVMDAASLGLARQADHKIIISDAGVDAVAGLDMSSSQDAAAAAIDIIDKAIKMVSEERSKLGAYQNRMEHTISNLGIANENLSSAESRIRDADMAKEMSTYTKTNIINQAATAMLAQANQLPQGILQLLK